MRRWRSGDITSKPKSQIPNPKTQNPKIPNSNPAGVSRRGLGFGHGVVGWVFLIWVGPPGFEPGTTRLGAGRSNHGATAPPAPRGLGGARPPVLRSPFKERLEFTRPR